MNLSAPLDYDDPIPCREVKDSLYDKPIKVFSYLVPFLDSPQVQRLREIKQLGATTYVWPNANHTRFGHSLGVSNLGRKLVTKLQRRHPELGITSRDIACVAIAGLCHDLGHGPFSHVWDDLFISRVLGPHKWCHEEGSEMMFDALIKNNKINMSLEDQNFVKALIAGDHTRTHHEKKVLFDIIANKTNRLDVDKLDYLCRDTAVLNMRMWVLLMSLHRLLSGARVDPQTGHICYIDKDILTVETFFLLRRYLHNILYNHKTVTAIGYMIGDAFIAADNYMKLSEAIYDPERYITLDDHIIKQIKESDCPELAESRKILERITSRDLYRKAGLRMIRCSDFPRIRAYVTPDRIVEATILYSEKMDSKDQEIASTLQPSDIIVHFSSRHFGMGEQNPMDILKFYSRDNLNDFHSARSTGQYDPQEPVCQHFLIVFVKQKKFLEVVKAGYKHIEENFIEYKVAESSPPAIDSA